MNQTMYRNTMEADRARIHALEEELAAARADLATALATRTEPRILASSDNPGYQPSEYEATDDPPGGTTPAESARARTWLLGLSVGACIILSAATWCALREPDPTDEAARAEEAATRAMYEEATQKALGVAMDRARSAALEDANRPQHRRGDRLRP